MSVSHNMLALFSSPPRQGGAAPVFAEPAPAGDGEGLRSFSEVLSGQQPDQLQGLLALLDGAPGSTELTALQELELAVDGKDLPPGMQGWLEQLADLDADVPAAGEWAQWLSQARLALGEHSGTADAGAEAVDADLLALSALPGGLSAAADARPAATLASLPLGSQLAAQGSLSADQLQQAQLERELRQENGAGSSKAERASLLDAQLQQRSQDPSLPGQDIRTAFTARLSDALETLSGKRGAAESEASEALQRPGTPSLAAAQGALAARPVLAATQTLGVPFGQAGWGDALIEKMQWASSQNLRSVEIRLDPAELGPLEIHIQTRGQEHQVQFVSQNPSVREALEAQMFRLRESFSQQGMDQVAISVGDSAVGQQARQESEGRSAGRGGAGSAAPGAPAADEAGMLLAAGALSQALSSRLVDYYA